mmetsp:Transcript_40052/g.85437  ORF Transcript_40052/g.85437 Transcript_40052/m.85437 type:complete len:231 (-) Transcript_40052:37-729(-)
MELSEREPQERPQIIYTLVSRDRNLVLVDYTPLQGNFQQATIQILPRLEHAVEGKSYIYGEYAFHYIVDDATGLWFVCMAERAMKRRVPFAFLGAVQEVVRQLYTGDQVQAAIAYGFQGVFRAELKQLMERYNSPRADPLASMTEKVRNINDNLMESIDKILERQEKIELLVCRSQSLSQSATSFRRESHQVRNAVWWRNVRVQALFVMGAVLVIAIIIWASCGIRLDRC